MTEQNDKFEEWNLELEEELDEYFSELDDEDFEDLEDLLLEEEGEHDPDFE